MNITLIGMAGAGKSFIGRKLAERCALDFVDIDDLLEHAYKKSIQIILEEVGEEKYLDLEEEMLIVGTSGRENMLIAPGGSVVYRDGAMRHIKDISKVVYLQVPLETIALRKNRAPPRAIIGLGSKSLRELYDERVPLYERYADIIIDAGARTLDEVLQTIIDRLEIDTVRIPSAV